MRSLALASLLCVSVIGCAADTSLNGVSPSSGFIGRSMRVEVSADNSSFGSSTTVDFGPGITVSSVTVASPTALFADIVIGDAVTPGVRDVVVHGGDTLALKSAFEVESPIKVELKGTLAQGSVATFTIRNLDFENPFDDTCTASSLFGCNEYGNLSVKSPPGTVAQLDGVSPYSLSGTLFLDIDATSGPFQVASGDPSGTVVMSGLGADTEVTARTAIALTGTANGTLTDAYGTQLYTVDAAATSVQRFAVTGASGAYILGASGQWLDLLKAGAKPNVVAVTAGKYYVVVADQSGDANVSYTVGDNPLALTPVAEAANDTKNAAQNLATNVTALVTNASLSSATDADWYQLTIPANSSTKKLHVVTTPGDPDTDTAVIIYASDGTTSLLTGASMTPVDRGYHEDVTSTSVGANATVYVKILPSDYFDPAASAYAAAIWLE